MRKKHVIFCVLFLVSILQNFSQNSSSKPVPTVEYQALVDFYNAMNGKNWNNKWDVSSNNLNKGSWYGVSVRDGHIVSIVLRQNNGLKGVIPRSFSNLKYLEKLDLYGYYNYHDLSSTDLNNLSGLENLKYLDLSRCKLKGKIPSSWSKLTKLKELYLYSNKLESGVENLGDLNLLEKLNLGDNLFTSIPNAIGKLENLRELYFNRNKLTGSVPKALEGLKSLIRLDLNYNQLSDIKAFFSDKVDLDLTSQDLILPKLEYKGDDIVLTNLPNIVKYNRESNDFSFKPSFRLYIAGSYITNNLVLSEDGSLVLSKEYFQGLKKGDEVYLDVVNGVAYNSKIKFEKIIIDQPKVPDTEYQALVDFYNAMNGKKWNNKWDVSSNNLNKGAWYGVSVRDGHIVSIVLRQNNGLKGAIPRSFSNLKYLEKLDLYGRYNGYGYHDLSSTDLNNLSGLENLKYLDLSYCKLKGKIPSSWSKLTKLKELYLDHNSLESGVENLGDLKSLEKLNLGDNLFTSIPNAIGKLENLRELYFNRNKLTGSVPKALEGLKSLIRLDFDYNQLSDIKAFFSDKVNLDLTRQDLILPKLEYKGDDIVLTNLPNIVKYNRESNDFSFKPSFRLYIAGSYITNNLVLSEDGSLVLSKEYFQGLKKGDEVYLDVVNGVAYNSKIKFEKIIIDLPKVPDTEYQALVDFYNAMNGKKWNNKWDVSSNNLNKGAWYGVSVRDGHIVSIVLRQNNGLKGAIPRSFSNLKYLEKLDLYGRYNGYHDLSSTNLNNLSGLENLKYLDLSRCKLKGKIPSSWSKLTKLKELYLYSNSLEGEIVDELGSLKLLEKLNLSNNKLTGSVPKALEGLKSLIRLDLGYNQLSDIKAFFSDKVDLDLTRQDLILPKFEYKGDDIVLTNLPNIVKYNREANDFSFKPSFRLYIAGSYITDNLVLSEDGSLVLSKEYFQGLKKGDEVYLGVVNGVAYNSKIKFEKIIIDLPKVPDTEYQALVDFYNAMNGKNWNNKWDVSSNNLNKGAWYGVSVRDGHIVSIVLPKNNGLKGAIPRSFSNLKYLEKLDLYGYYNDYHDLSSTNLNNLSGLENLKYLNLVNCKLKGEIPSSWSKLTKLKELYLDYNSLENIDKSIIKLSIEKVNVANQSISKESILVSSGKIKITLPLHFVIQKTEKGFDFNAKNRFKLYVNGRHKQTAFSNNGELIFLNVNLLGLKEIDKIRITQENGLAHGSNINYQKVSFGKPLVEQEFEILKKIYSSTNGEKWNNKWDVSVNNVNKTSWYGVSIADGHVVALNLFNNNLSGKLPEELSNLTRLKVLKINNNLITGSLPKNIFKLKELEVLNVTSNQLSGLISPKISELEKLKTFAIGNNSFKGTIPSVLSDFKFLEHLDLSSNGFDKIEKKFYYNLEKTFVDFRNQKINYPTVLTLNGSVLKVDLDDIVAYDLKNNNYKAKNTFSLFVNGLKHDTAVINEKGEILFKNVRISEIPQNSKIIVRQTSGSFLNSEFTFAGIEDKSRIPLKASEFKALKTFYASLNGKNWKLKWDLSKNNIHTKGLPGVTLYDGHVVGIDLSDNNLTGVIPNIFKSFPNLKNVDLSSNKIKSVAKLSFVKGVVLNFDRQDISAGSLTLTRGTVLTDFKINRYLYKEQGFKNQTYRMTVGGVSKTFNMPSTGVSLSSVLNLKNLKVKKGSLLTLRQLSGDAMNSVITYKVNFKEGDVNLDGVLNILDLQTTINNILGKPSDYFNYNEADANKDNEINILDVVKLVSTIQNQGEQPVLGRSKHKLSNEKKSEVSLRFLNNQLILNTEQQKITALEVKLAGLSKNAISEKLSDLGFSVSVREKNKELSIIAYSFDKVLLGKVILASFNKANDVKLKSVILTNALEQHIPVKYLTEESTLSVKKEIVLNKQKLINYPNPFINSTIIRFDLNHQQTVVLSVYNQLGEKVFTNNFIAKKGVNNYHYAPSLAPGVYNYCIELVKNNSVLHGKMIVK